MLKPYLYFLLQTPFRSLWVSSPAEAGQQGRKTVSEDKGNTLRTISTDQAIGQCTSLIGRLRLAAAEGYSEEAEHVCKMLSDHMSSVRLPCDYLRETLAAARHLHMQAAMKATEIALDRASALGRAKQTLEHAREM